VGEDRVLDPRKHLGKWHRVSAAEPQELSSDRWAWSSGPQGKTGGVGHKVKEPTVARVQAWGDKRTTNLGGKPRQVVFTSQASGEVPK